MSKHETAPTLGKFPHLYPYVMQHIGEHPIQSQLRDQVTSLERPGMMGSPDEAQFLAWMVRTMGLNKIIEVGVFRGTTTLALALAVKANIERNNAKKDGGAAVTSGRIVGFDVSSDYAAVGREAWQAAGVETLIDFRVGPASDGLSQLLAEEGNEGTFDLAFIDADKANYPDYYEKCLRLLRPGGIIAVDNVLWSARVLLPESELDADSKAIVAINKTIREDPRVDATMLPIADGVFMCTKL